MVQFIPLSHELIYSTIDFLSDEFTAAQRTNMIHSYFFLEFISFKLEKYLDQEVQHSTLTTTGIGVLNAKHLCLNPFRYPETAQGIGVLLEANKRLNF